MEYETRKLPKKTIIYVAILLILGLISMFAVKDGKAKKATKILVELGFTKVSNVTVFSRTEFLNESTNVKGYQYSLVFDDLVAKKQCKGFILKDFKGNINKDLDCK